MTTWRDDKRRQNLAKHGIDFAIAERFDFDAALVGEDTDAIYGERRFKALGPVGDQLYVYVYTLNHDGSEEHAISLLLAEPKERRLCAREI